MALPSARGQIARRLALAASAVGLAGGRRALAVARSPRSLQSCSGDSRELRRSTQGEHSRIVPIRSAHRQRTHARRSHQGRSRPRARIRLRLERDQDRRQGAQTLDKTLKAVVVTRADRTSPRSPGRDLEPVLRHVNSDEQIRLPSLHCGLATRPRRPRSCIRGIDGWRRAAERACGPEARQGIPSAAATPTLAARRNSGDTRARPAPFQQRTAGLAPDSISRALLRKSAGEATIALRNVAAPDTCHLIRAGHERSLRFVAHTKSTDAG